MPGFDGTGPLGMGPMTGGGRGFCNPYPRTRTWWRPGPWFGRGRGRGWRFLRTFPAGGGPGFWGFGPPGQWAQPFGLPYTREQELEYLRDEAAALKDELEAIDKRLRELESQERQSESTE